MTGLQKPKIAFRRTDVSYCLSSTCSTYYLCTSRTPDPLLLSLKLIIIIMHHFTALLVPELLEKILSHMDRNDNVVNMRVCKTWSEIALDLVWREVESLPRLFTLLRPYRHTNDGPTVRRLFSIFHLLNERHDSIRRSLTDSQIYRTGRDFKSMPIVCALCDTVRDKMITLICWTTWPERG